MGDASGPALVTSTEEDRQNGGGGVPSTELENGKSIDDGGAGNRWPRPETLSLLQIRSDMDTAFKDSTLKAPLWEQISRKMAELGYKRSAKKCKEKFENVYKYHKRTKEGRLSAGKPDGKSYRFFEELEAFDQKNHRTSQPAIPMPQPIIIDPINVMPEHIPVPPAKEPASPSSSSTASDEECQAPRQRGRLRKRKWKDFFRQLTGQVVRKQEEMHRQFLDTVARCEAARATRDHAWHTGEASRLDQLARDRAAAASKDAAVLALLNTLSQDHSISPSPSPSPRVVITTPSPINADPISSSLPPPPELVGSSSRWPKAEVESLIRIRTTLETKYGESGPKGPLWEEISAAMRRTGYERSAKRCKEKWENINKYFKKVKDNNKMRSQDSKTCPYFHTLDALYKEKTNSGEPKSVQPERQWPLLHQQTSTTIATRGLNLLDDDEQDLDEDSSGTEVDDDHHNHHRDSNEDQDHHEVTGGGGGDSYGIVSKKMDMVE